jgi:hypothetical protein
VTCTDIRRVGHGENGRSMSAIRTWIAFVDAILDDLGASAAYRAKAMADAEAMIRLGLLDHTPLEWFSAVLARR